MIRPFTVFAATAVTFGSLLAVQTVQASPLPILRYTFDGQNVNDTGSVLPAADGTYINPPASPYTTDTPSGTGFALNTGDGFNRYTTTATSPAKLSGLSEFTLTTWFKLTGNPTELDRLMSIHDATLPNRGYELFIANPNVGSISATDFALVTNINAAAFSNKSTADIEYALGTWLFIATTWDTATEEIRYFVGTQTASVTQLGGIKINAAPVGTLNASALFEVAGSPQAAGDRTPPAFYDDVRVYGQSLTLAQLEDVRLSNIPEPGSLALLGLGGLLMLSRRSRV